MPTHGALTWLIPDAYLATPADDDPINKNHESICVLNTTVDDANLIFDFYFEDRDAVEGIKVKVPRQTLPAYPPRQTGAKLPAIRFPLMCPTAYVFAAMCRSPCSIRACMPAAAKSRA